MGDKTGIEWTDATWNPTTGCTKVSQGCKHCYAERDWPRLVHLPNYKGRAFTDVARHPVRLLQPLQWKKPRRIFVNSMSDLFHEDIPDEFIDDIFTIMALCQRHTFQVLTKRPARMLNYMKRLGKSAKLLDIAAREIGYTFLFDGRYNIRWPIQNVWLGVSVEDQSTADERTPLLLQTPAAVRWISAEPVLGPVRVGQYLSRTNMPGLSMLPGFVDPLPGIDWVVAGGESGPKARPMHPQWARSLRDQCAAAGVPFFFKQWGEWAPQPMCGKSEGLYLDIIGGQHPHTEFPQVPEPNPCRTSAQWHWVGKCGKHAAGRLLDGALHDGYPEVASE